MNWNRNDLLYAIAMSVTGIAIVVLSRSFIILLVLPLLIFWSLACVGFIVASILSGVKWLKLGILGLLPLVIFLLAR